MFYHDHHSPRISQEHTPAQHHPRRGGGEDAAVRSPATVLFLAVCAILLVLALPGCGASASTPSIGDTRMASDKEGEHPTKVFSENDAFYVLAELNDVSEGTPVSAVWTAANVKGVKPDTRLKQQQLSTKSGIGQVTFSLVSKAPWPTGDYEVDLYLDGAKKPTKTVAFEVR